MPSGITEIPDDVIEDAFNELSEVIEDTKYTQQASADAWQHIAEQARERHRCIEAEIENADDEG